MAKRSKKASGVAQTSDGVSSSPSAVPPSVSQDVQGSETAPAAAGQSEVATPPPTAPPVSDNPPAAMGAKASATRTFITCHRDFFVPVGPTIVTFRKGVKTLVEPRVMKILNDLDVKPLDVTQE